MLMVLSQQGEFLLVTDHLCTAFWRMTGKEKVKGEFI